MTDISNALTKLTAAARALAEAKTLDEIKQIRDVAVAAHTYAKAAKLGLDAQNHAAEITLRAERKAGELLKHLEKDEGGRPPKNSFHRGMSLSEYRQVLEQNDIAPVTAFRWQQIADLPEQAFEQHIVEALAGGSELTTSGMLRVVKEYERQVYRQDMEALGTRAALSQAGKFRLVCADFTTVDLAPESVDAIITDPPYTFEAIGLYGQLAAFGARVLKPGGSLLAMCGQSYLLEVGGLMATHLRYRWAFAYLTPGGQAPQIWQRQINTFWKPVLWFVKGEYSGSWISDVVKSDVNDNDKRFSDWGQSESGIAGLIERASRPGDVILDPFCGGGTTGVVALARNRQFIGIDKGERQLHIAAGRIARLCEASVRGDVE